MNEKQIELYLTESGDSPFIKWLIKLGKVTRIIVHKYIDRVVSGGSKKNIKALDNGIFEIKIRYGPGYRVYFAEDKECIILLLLGGDKDSQKSDILKANKYWSHYGKKKRIIQ
jgi:putative addiction module killer protein